jgi:hypothetical protein
MTLKTCNSCVHAGMVVLLLGSAPLLAAPPAPQHQLTFASPQAAAEALIAAVQPFDVPALIKILGPGGKDLISTEDAIQDQQVAALFAIKAREKLSIVPDPKNPNSRTMVLGTEGWPSPIPIVKQGRTWRFDSVAGKKEVFIRRIGRNELDAIQVCRGYVEAQYEYASKKHDGAQVNQYAQKVISTEGRQDGLAWRNADGTWEGPVGEEIARFIAEGYHDKYEPYHGYYFKILKGQGPSAPLGQMDYVVDGAMIGGFAMVAAPADYRKTGVKTFLVSHSGVVYEKDLGQKTYEWFRALERYNPDKSWSLVKEP